MRPVFLALLVSAALPLRAAAELRNFDDAPLFAVQFLDAREGWASGAEGVIWHTIDGGKTWERQPTGTRATLRALHFLNPYTGWAAGREDLPAGGSSGVLLFTKDGGLKWQRVALGALPGLNAVRFLDGRTGFAAGDGSEAFPSGLFVTTDSGRSWQPVPGPRTASWQAADFLDQTTGALGGAWNQLAMLRQDRLLAVAEETLGGRTVRAVRFPGRLGLAAGQGGLMLVNDDTAKSTWSHADLRLPTELRAAWDFHALAAVGQHLWAAGRPGSVVLHSPDAGATWEVLKTRQPLPLNGLFFLDETTGWAVGEFGAILATRDGGKTWTVQHRGGERAAVLVIHGRGGAVPLETVAALGGEDGYLTVGLRVAASDPATAAPVRALEAQRFAAGMRQAGGAAGEVLWQFPLAADAARTDKTEIVRTWDARHAGRAADELLRQLVLTLRLWRPEVVITDQAAGSPDAPGLDALVAEAVAAACQRSDRADVFPEQLTGLGLSAWRPAKVYALAPDKDKGKVVLDAGEPSPRLLSSPRDFAEPAARLVADRETALPTTRFFAYLDGRLEGAAAHRSLLQGIALAPGGEARRQYGDAPELTGELRQALETRRNLQKIAELPPGGLSDPGRLLAQVGPLVQNLPDDQGAPAAQAVAAQYARLGQWDMAREVYLLLADRYPTHPLAAEAVRWLVRHASSSELRRRQELGHFVVVQNVNVQTHGLRPEGTREAPPKDLTPGAATDPAKEAMPGADGEIRPRKPARPTGPVRFEQKSPQPNIELVVDRATAVLEGREAARRWYQGALAMESRLSGHGPLPLFDPAIQFCLQAARRNLGEWEAPRNWAAGYVARQPAGPWRDAAQAELWLVSRQGPPPKPAIPCRLLDSRPFLDGKLDDPCWQEQPLVLRPAAASAAPPAEDSDSRTEVRLAYDRDYLYLALRCRQPKERYVPPLAVRPRDADTRKYDRVSLMLDLDRDYASYYHLEVDQRGCVAEEFCIGDQRDRSWDPRWFVACHSEPGVWQIEAAIPLAELTGDPITYGKVWACNVVRVSPGRGVQALSLPAEADPRPEGMGLLLFNPDQRRAAASPGGGMPRVP